MRILLIGGLKDNKARYHYSDTKTLQLALGFISLGHTVFMPEDSDHHDHPNIQKVSLDVLCPQGFHMIMFTRENFIKYYWDKYPVIQQIMTKNVEKFDKFPLICARYGSHYWYKNFFKSVDDFYASFDYHFPQEYSFCKRLIFDMSVTDGGRIWPSNMAVPQYLSFSETSPFEKDKKILLYIGRLRQVPPRYDFIIQFMKTLGNDYRLLIIPGSFNKIIQEESTKFNPVQDVESKQWLVNRFAETNNISVLDPVPWGPHWDYLYHADYGIDFSPSMKGSGGGNAKLTEYMRAGLPTLTEPSVTNSWLIHFCKGGIIAPSSYDLEGYVDAFRRLESTQWDRSHISCTMSETHNWSVRANEMLCNIGITEDRDLSSI
jgi:hypothetical protein